MRDLRDAATNGTRLDVLVALRDRIAAEIEAGVPAKELSPLARQLQAVVKDIEELSGPQEGSAASDLAARRAARRRPGASAPRRAAR